MFTRWPLSHRLSCRRRAISFPSSAPRPLTVRTCVDPSKQMNRWRHVFYVLCTLLYKACRARVQSPPLFHAQDFYRLRRLVIYLRQGPRAHQQTSSGNIIICTRMINFDHFFHQKLLPPFSHFFIFLHYSFFLDGNTALHYHCHTQKKTHNFYFLSLKCPFFNILFCLDDYH